MRIGVIGAGMAGLGAARELAAAGHAPVIYDSHTAPGGRVSTYRSGGYAVDMGATVIAPRAGVLQQVLRSELAGSELTQIALPVYTHSALRPRPGDPARGGVERFAYASGNDRLAELAANGLDLRLGRTIEELVETAGGFAVLGEEYDAVIVTAPAPEAVRILATVGRRRSLGNCTYRVCLSVALGFDRDLPPKPYFALVDTLQRHPLTWLSIESLKCRGRAPEGHTAMVAQLSAEFSLAHLDAEESVIVSTTLGMIERLFGAGWDAPKMTRVFRWPYSHPENIALFETVNHPGSRLLVASDGLLGGRVEYAYEVGVRTARMLLGEL